MSRKDNIVGKHESRFYRWLQNYFIRALGWGMRLHPYHTEREQTEGRLLVCANHTSVMDVFALAAVFRRQLRFMAKKELFGVPILGKLIHTLGAFPVDRKAGDVGALKKALALLEDEEAVAVFPQGTRCAGIDPAQTEVRSGVGLLAYRAHADVQPVFVRVKGYRYRFLRRKDVIMGEPIRYEEFGFTNGGREEYERAAKLIFDRILALRNEGLEE